MARDVYELQGFTLALDKVQFITRVFEADAGEGFQFNVRFSHELRLTPKFATRTEAELERSQLVAALKG